MTDQVETYEKALQGIASCATLCECCKMHVGVATRVLEQYDAKVKLSPATEALMNRCPECDL